MMITQESISRLLDPGSVVIVGASARPESPGGRVFSGLKRLGYEGAIHLVNPGRSELNGHPCVSAIEDVPLGVDLAVLCIPKAATQTALESCIARGVGAVVVFAAGYAEQDLEGAADQERLAATARAAGVALLGPNCLGFANIRSRAPITMMQIAAAESDLPGVAVVAQSGAFMSSLQATLALKNAPMSYLASVGNQAVLGVEDLIEYLIEDSGTQVIAVFAERLREPQRFLALAARARRRNKPIVMMHTGRSRKARDAALSHTGALAGDDAIMRALVEHEAVILVESIDELADVAALAAFYPQAPTHGVGVVTNSGALRGITFDYCEAVGLDVPTLERQTVERVSARLPAFAVSENPVDLTVQALTEPELIGFGARTLLDDPNIGSVVLAVHAGTEAIEYARLAGPMLANSTKPVAYSVLGEGAPLPLELLDTLRQYRIPLFRSVERSLGAVAKLTAYGRLRSKPERPAAMGRGPSIGKLASGTMTEFESKQWLAELGVPIPCGKLAQSLAEAKRIAANVGYPLALKAQAVELPHKSDAGGVVLNIKDDEALERAWLELLENVQRAKPGVRLDGVLVERMASPGVELVIGIKRDPDWGPVMVIGLGGVWIEIMKDVRLIPLGMTEDAIAEELKKLRAYAILEGARGTAPADVRALAKVAATIGEAVAVMPEILEIDINPLIVYPETRGVLALDALIVTSSAA